LTIVTPSVIMSRMIKSFRDRDTERFFQRHPSCRWPTNMNRVAWRKLAILDAAERLKDVAIPPGKRLEKLTGDQSGQHGIRINEQWRICFRWKGGDAYDVEIVDYR
jgi:toxin HigB-1